VALTRAKVGSINALTILVFPVIAVNLDLFCALHEKKLLHYDEREKGEKRLLHYGEREEGEKKKKDRRNNDEEHSKHQLS